MNVFLNRVMTKLGFRREMSAAEALRPRRTDESESGDELKSSCLSSGLHFALEAL